MLKEGLQEKRGGLRELVKSGLDTQLPKERGENRLESVMRHFASPLLELFSHHFV